MTFHAHNLRQLAIYTARLVFLRENHANGYPDIECDKGLLESRIENIRRWEGLPE